MHSQPLPGPTLELLNDMRTIARFLDRIADTAPTPDAEKAARSHAIAQWTAIDRVDELAGFVNDLAAVASSSIARES